MSKKLIASTLLFAGLLASSVPASASEPFFNAISGTLRSNDFFHRLESPSPAPMPTRTPIPMSGNYIDKLLTLYLFYYHTVEQPLRESLSLLTNNYSINFVDQDGSHVFVLRELTQLFNMTDRALNLVAQLTDPLLNLEFPPEELEHHHRLLEQLHNQLQAIIAEWRRIPTRKPTVEDITSGRCIDFNSI